MKSHTKHDWIIGFIIVPFLLMCANVLSHNHWDSLNNPEGKFTNVSEYLAQERSPSYITKVNKQGATFLIAYSSMDDMRLHVPSGPAAYVFDETGKLVQWSKDSGDDSQFSELWLKSQQKKSSLEELKQLGFQQNIQEEVLNSRP